MICIREFEAAVRTAERRSILGPPPGGWVDSPLLDGDPFAERVTGLEAHPTEDETVKVLHPADAGDPNPTVGEVKGAIDG